MADQLERRDAALDFASHCSHGSDALLERLAPRANQACLRLRGGGGDGGATGAESRSSYLEMYKTQKPGEVRAPRVAPAAAPSSPACPLSWMHARSNSRYGHVAV